MQTQKTDHKQLVHALNMCIETCTDAEKGYASAAADVRDPDLKTLFQLKSSERAEFVIALQRVIQKLGAYPENQGTAQGTLHQGWVNVRKAVEGRNDRMITGECERSEANSLKHYEAALRLAPLDTMPSEIGAMVLAQHDAIEAAYDALHRRFV